MIRESNNNYISLQEATEYCSYTQEYLSLRARQGKLKAVKIGRNWITKKEWVKEYIERMKEYNNNLKEKKLAEPPENLPVEEKLSVRTTSQQAVPKIRVGFSFALVLALLITGIAFGKESFKSIFNDLDPYVKEINQAGDIIVESTAKILSETISDIPHSFINISGTIDNTFSIIAEKVLKPGQELAAISSPDVLKSTLNIFKEYGLWISQTFKSGYLAFNYFIEEKLDNASRVVLSGLKSFAKGIRKIPQAITGLFKKEIVIEEPEEKFAKKEEIEKLQKELQALKEEGLPVKEIIKEIEVSRITKIEPIKEITKEIKTLDDQSLKRIRTILSQQETEVEKLKLAARLGYINFPAFLSPSGAVSVTILGTIAAGTWQGTAISTQYGGSGADLSAGAQGGVLYMGGSSIMGISAAGTSGDALISGGTGVPTWTNTPSWSTITLSTSVTSPLYTSTGAVEVSSAGGAALTLDSDSGTVQLAAGDSLTVPGTITAQTTGSDFTGTVTVGTLVANTQINTGAGAGTIRINATGDLSNIGDITFTGSPTLAIANAGSITWTDGTNTLMQLADSGAYGTLTVNTISPTTINAFTLGGAITGNSQNITNLGQLTVDSLQLDGTTIGLTTDTDLLSLADNQLTVNGTLALGSNNITMTGSLAADGARVLKGWFTDIESTNMPTVGGTSLSTTFVDVAGDTMGGDLNMGGNIIYGSTADNGDLILKTTTSATKTTSYIILADDGGNVGIGTAGPSFKLEVAGDIGPDGHITRDLGSLTAAWNDVYVDTLKIDTGGNIYGIESERIGITASFEPDTASGYSLGGTTKEWANLYIGTGRIYLGAGQESSIYASANDLILSPSGNVGIGTTSPTAHLQIDGDISAAAWTTDGIAFDSNAATYTDTSTVAAGTVAVRTANSFGAPTFASTNAITVTDAFTLYVPKPIAGTNTTITRANSAYFEGNVGIGTTAPTAKLDVNGNIKASGGIESIGTAPYALISDDIAAAGTFLDVGDPTPYKSVLVLGLRSESNAVIGQYMSGSSGFAGINVSGSYGSYYGFTYDINSPANSWFSGMYVYDYYTILYAGGTQVARVESWLFDVNTDVELDATNTATTNGLCHSGADSDTTFTDRYIVACSAAPGDIAEWYDIKDGESGDIVAITGETIIYESPAVNARTGEVLNEKEKLTVSVLAKTDKPYQPNILGIISTSPYETFGKSIIDYAQNPNPVSLIGRAPVKVSAINGPIKPGDLITSSEIPGVGMKATKAGRVIGLALEPYDDREEIGRILLFVNPHWSLGSLSEDGSLAESDDNEQAGDESESTSTDDSAEKPTILDQFTLAIRNALKKLGLIIENGIASIKTLIVENLKIGSSEKPTGITIYDEETGQPYCVKMKGGQMVSTLGECGEDINISPDTNSTNPQSSSLPPLEEINPTPQSDIDDISNEPTLDEISENQLEEEPALEESENKNIESGTMTDELGGENNELETEEPILEELPIEEQSMVEESASAETTTSEEPVTEQSSPEQSTVRQQPADQPTEQPTEQ